MAVFSTDFSEYTTGVQPADWTERWVTTNSDWTKEGDGGTGALGAARLQHVATADGRRLLSWNDIDADANRDNAEILARVRTNTVTAFQNAAVVRGSGAAGSETGYAVFFSGGTTLQLFKFVAGVATQVGSSITFPWLASKWYWIRFRVNGSDLKVKVWDGDHNQEPAAWNLETTDASIAAAGWVGFGASESDGIRSYDDIAVGTNGDTAVFPPSTEARVTQGALLVLAEEGGADARITQATVLALAGFDAETRITQLATLVLADHIPCVQRWATCWTFTRTDGLVLGYTSHDQTVSFRGVDHVPCNSLAASAVEMSSIVGSTGSIDLIGLLSDAGVSEKDIYNGLYDGANIEVWLVPWSNAGGETPIRLIAGVVGANGHETASYRQELLTEGQRLQQRALLETITPGCRFLFGNQVDPRCPVDLSLLEVTGSVTALAIPNASTDSTRRIFSDSTRLEADGYFSLGRMTWTTGANVGAVSEVKDFIGGQFILWESLLNPIGIADAYTATPGCDKSPTAHLAFEPDMKKFGGFPFVSGPDMLVRRPDAKG